MVVSSKNDSLMSTCNDLCDISCCFMKVLSENWKVILINFHHYHYYRLGSLIVRVVSWQTPALPRKDQGTPNPIRNPCKLTNPLTFNSFVWQSWSVFPGHESRAESKAIQESRALASIDHVTTRKYCQRIPRRRVSKGLLPVIASVRVFVTPAAPQPHTRADYSFSLATVV